MVKPSSDTHQLPRSGMLSTSPISIMQSGTLVIPSELLLSRLSSMECVMMAAAAAATSTASGTTTSGEAVTVGSEANARFAVLSYEQVKRLDSVMDLDVPIHGRGNFPTLDVKLKALVQVVRAKLEAESVRVKDIRLNGGAASYVLADSTQPYNDIDLIFGVDLSGGARDYDRVKNAVLDSLLDFLPSGVNKKRISSCSLKEGYVHKMVKVQGQPGPAAGSGGVGGGGVGKSGTGGDRWSLISLSNSSVHGGRNVELKFVDTMRRQFEFSVDSFQVILDSLLLFYDCAEMPMGESFYPTVVGESVYGHFHESLGHLRRKLIATRNPEEIRGGGLLKYCNLLVRDYRPVRADEIKSLERYMCSRFFIDFSDLGQQQQKLENYLTNHFAGEEHLMYQYLVTLHRVVDESTVCLMGHERRQTLGLIEELACQIYFREQQQRFFAAAAAATASSNGKQTTPPPPPPPQTGVPQYDFPHLFYQPHHHHPHHHPHHHHPHHHHQQHHHQPQHSGGAFYYAGHYIPQQPPPATHHAANAATSGGSSSSGSAAGGQVVASTNNQHQQYSCAPVAAYSWMPCA